MAWPRLKNSRSSAQPGTHPHDGARVIVTPAPDAEPPPGIEQNTGVGSTTHAIAPEGGDLDAPGPTAGGSRVGQRRRPIRYGHSANDRTPAVPTSAFGTPTVPAAVMPQGGTVLPGSPPPGPDTPDEHGDYDGTAGLVYEAPRAAGGEPADARTDPVHNEGLGIFGGVATTEAPEDAVPTRELELRPVRPVQPPPRAAVSTVDIAWNQTIAPPSVASSAEPERNPNPFSRIRGIRLRGGQPADDGEAPQVSVRDLPPDVQMSFIRDRVIIAVVVGVVSFIFLREWPLSVTLMIIVIILDMVRRQRSAANYVNAGAHPGARKATSKQLRKLRRDGYCTLEARPIPHSREVIDHLVIGPTGVYAIDSEKWNPKVPVRTLNGTKLYHGPESQKDRLEHAAWEAAQASEVLSGALGYEVKVRPALAIYGPRIPWDIATIRNVDVFTGTALGKYLKARRRMKVDVPRLTQDEVRKIYDAAARVLPDVADSYAPVS